jgi:hypothetical protein
MIDKDLLPIESGENARTVREANRWRIEGNKAAGENLPRLPRFCTCF